MGCGCSPEEKSEYHRVRIKIMDDEQIETRTNSFQHLQQQNFILHIIHRQLFHNLYKWEEKVTDNSGGSARRTRQIRGGKIMSSLRLKQWERLHTRQNSAEVGEGEGGAGKEDD